MNQGHANFFLCLGNGVPLDSPAILESHEMKKILRAPYLSSALFPQGAFSSKTVRSDPDRNGQVLKSI